MYCDKNIVFIISAGRTGTKYFGTLLDCIIENSFSVHEPDIFSGLNKKFVNQVKYFGFYNMVIGRALRRSGIRNLSENYLANKISFNKLKNKIIKHRCYYYNSIYNDLIIESYYGWYGCMSAIREIFPNYKIIVITRDPRNWITSNMNWNKWYGNKDLLEKYKFGRLNPKLIGDNEYINQWDKFTQFEKLCWAYKTIYTTILRNIHNDENCMLVKFEDLFNNKDKHNQLEQLIKYIVKFQNKCYNYNIPNDILEKKIHKNIYNKFPQYENWDLYKKERYWKICEDIQYKLGY